MTLSAKARFDLGLCHVMCAAGGNPFRGYQLREAVLKFKQGFGRLIRIRTDRGTVVCLDPRIVTKPYGRLFIDSLPDCRHVAVTTPRQKPLRKGEPKIVDHGLHG